MFPETSFNDRYTGSAPLPSSCLLPSPQASSYYCKSNTVLKHLFDTHVTCMLCFPKKQLQCSRYEEPRPCPQAPQHSLLRQKAGCSVFVRQASRSVVIGVLATAAMSVGFLVSHGVLVSSAEETLKALSCITRRSRHRRSVTKLCGHSLHS